MAETVAEQSSCRPVSIRIRRLMSLDGEGMKTAEELRARRIAELAAYAAVARAFRLFGIDIEDADAVNSLRDDWRFTRDQRLDTERRAQNRARGYLALLIAVVTSVLTGIATWAAAHWDEPRI